MSISRVPLLFAVAARALSINSANAYATHKKHNSNQFPYDFPTCITMKFLLSLTQPFYHHLSRFNDQDLKVKYWKLDKSFLVLAHLGCPGERTSYCCHFSRFIQDGKSFFSFQNH